MTQAGRFTVPAEHPALPGHFPGRPVVPGVMLLDRVITAVAGGRRAIGLPSVKFTRPVQPGCEIEVSCEAGGDGRVAFRCTVDGEEVARGTVAFETA